MSDAVVIEIIRACALVPTAMAAAASAWFSYRASTYSQRAVKIAKATEENTNHMKDELVALTAKSSHAEGMLEGQKIAGEGKD